MGLVALLGVLAAGTAGAQATSTSQAIDMQRYKPAPGAGDVLGLHGARVGRHLDWNVGLSLNYASNPLGVVDPRSGDFVYAIIQDQFTADVLGSLTLFDRVELGVVLPVTAQASEGASPASPLRQQGLSATGVGDLRLVPKVHLVRRGGLDVAVVVPVALPTGGGSGFLGSSGPSAQPRAVAEWRGESGLRLLANAGLNLREQQRLRNVTAGHELAFGLGADVPLASGLALQAQLGGALGLAEQDVEERPLELLAALRYRFNEGLAAHVGGGPGLTRGHGTPTFRLFAGLGWAAEGPRPAPQPVCTLGPEDLDGFQDDDGCLDPDNDGDGIADGPDLCPNEAETLNGLRDEDGCPDPEEALASASSGTPAQPPLTLTPTADSDGDGLADEEDRCPTAAEDRDGFEDEDGCPEADNDRDGLADASDACPLEAETLNGVQDEDGCPDKGQARVRLEGTRIAILDKVYFATSKDVILARSFALLEQVASVLRAHPRLLKVRVEGYTDSQGNDAVNLALSQRRAERVRDFLIQKGIAAERLEAVGYGEAQPVDDNKTASGRENNRRVEFNIIEVADDAATAQGVAP